MEIILNLEAVALTEKWMDVVNAERTDPMDATHGSCYFDRFLPFG
jgi:hypothetical protein